jgi:hypothetical protein
MATAINKDKLNSVTLIKKMKDYSNEPVFKNKKKKLLLF